MNIFATEQGILGDTDYARLHNTFHAFLTLARSIRKRLGARAYMLDEYIRQLLIACSIPLEDEFFDREDSATNALAASCRMVAKGGGQKSAQANGYSHRLPAFFCRLCCPVRGNLSRQNAATVATLSGACDNSGFHLLRKGITHQTFREKVVCQQGCRSPLLETQSQGGCAPSGHPCFRRLCIYKSAPACIFHSFRRHKNPTDFIL